MPKAVIEDWDEFNAFLASQPLFQWLAQKQQETATGVFSGQARPPAKAAPKNDNADLAAALASMA